MFSEPHSTKQIEDALDWSSDISPQTLVDTTAGRIGGGESVSERFEVACRDVRCPVSVVHGTDDLISPPAQGEHLALLTGGSLTLIEGGGHGLMARDPVRINTMIHEFVHRVSPTAPTDTP